MRSLVVHNGEDIPSKNSGKDLAQEETKSVTHERVIDMESYNTVKMKGCAIPEKNQCPLKVKMLRKGVNIPHVK